MAPKKFLFVYRRSRVNYGSTTMRAHQLIEAVAPFMPEFAFELTSVSRRPLLQRLWAYWVPRGSFLFITKGVLRILTHEAYQVLRRRGCRICYDPVDLPIECYPGSEMMPDVYVSPSVSGVERIQSLLLKRDQDSLQNCKVMLLLHAADVRLSKIRHRPLTRARIIYWGLPRNAVLSEAICERIDVVDGSTGDEVEKTLSILGQYNVHYAVRPCKISDFIKPFTKGANAAVLGANIVVNRDVDDGIELLGADYPYFVDSLTEASILKCLKRIEEGFGGAEWCLAEERMKALAQRVSPSAIASQLRGIAEELGT